MQAKLLHHNGGQRTFAIILETGDETMASLTSFALRENISAAQLTAVGAFSHAQLAYFNWEAKVYEPLPVAEQVEVASFIGDVAIGPDDQPSLHAHVVLGRRDGSAIAGHLQAGVVRPTLEVILTESPAHLCKRKDAESGLALIRVRDEGGA